MISPQLFPSFLFLFLKRSIAFLVSFAFWKRPVLTFTVCSPDPVSPLELCSSTPLTGEAIVCVDALLHLPLPSGALEPFEQDLGLCEVKGGVGNKVGQSKASATFLLWLMAGCAHQDGDKPCCFCGPSFGYLRLQNKLFRNIWEFFLEQISVAPRV